MAASTDDDEARRLAELIGGDSDSDEEETDADRLRMAQLLGRRGISDEASDDDDAPVVTTPALVPRAPPAPPQLVVLPPEVRSGTKRNPEVGGIGATTAEGPARALGARPQPRAAALSGVHGPEPPPPPRRAPPPEPSSPCARRPCSSTSSTAGLDGDATPPDEDADAALGPDAAPAAAAAAGAGADAAPPEAALPRRLERINDRLHALQNDEAVDEDELDLRRDAPVVVESDEDAAVFCRAAALAHDVATAGGCEIEVDFVWENEARDDPRSAGQALASMAGRFAKKGAPPSPPPPDKPWRPASPRSATYRADPWQVDSRVHGSDRRSAADTPPDAWLYARAWPPDDVGYDHVEESAKKGQGTWDNGALLRRAPYDGGSRVELGRLFRKHGARRRWRRLVPGTRGCRSTATRARGRRPGAGSGPGSSTRGPSAPSALGADEPEPGADGWLYGFDWPRDGAGYAARPTPRSFVRCRRWVRPREPLDAGKPPSRSHSEEDGLIPIDDPGAPPPPRASNVKLFS
ncbi:hypothetical protein JL720_11082 [Aureococcus anophagefferens]|nr:hypothetical protein JL720_11082 [Aureococcus anophagefferens]